MHPSPSSLTFGARYLEHLHFCIHSRLDLHLKSPSAFLASRLSLFLLIFQRLHSINIQDFSWHARPTVLQLSNFSRHPLRFQVRSSPSSPHTCLTLPCFLLVKKSAGSSRITPGILAFFLPYHYLPLTFVYHPSAKQATTLCRSLCLLSSTLV